MTGPRATPALRFEAVTFTYPDAAEPALRDVSLELAHGVFALVTGATGAGKSTFLRCANGLVPHFSGGEFSGKVLADGRDSLNTPPRKLADVVAFVPQDPAASFVLDRVEDELAYGMENLAVPAQQMRRRVEETLDLLALTDLRDRSVRTLSGGERQRVAIGAALAAGPRILVLDEPTSQLDPQGAEDVLAALQRLVHDHGMTVLLAEHRLERVAGFVDLAVACEAGRVSTGTPAEIISRLRNGPPVTRLGSMLGWNPAPLTVRDARTRAAESAPLGRVEGAPTPPTTPTTTAGDALLEARQVSAGYGDSAEPVVRGADLSIRAGEIVALMGRNGAGKTTLLRCLAGVHEPSYGSVISARTGGAPEPGVDTALCPQEPENVLFKDTVSDEVLTTIRARRNASAGDGLDSLLAALGIGDLAERHPHDLSAGQRLLVATAAIVATGAPVLLLDEPTRGLDPDAKKQLAAFLRTHAAGGDRGDRGGGAAIFATHDVELAAALATRVVILAGGEVIADGSPAGVLGDSHVFAPQMTRVFGAGWLTPEQVVAAKAETEATA